MRVLIGGVGYRNLRDLSLGPVLIDRLQHQRWPEGVEVEDLSYGPVGVMHSLDAREPYQRIVLVAGVRRGGEPGTVRSYLWEGQLPAPEEVQARVVEAVSGVVSLDNLLIVASYFRRLPGEVVVIEVEVADEGWGEGFSPAVERALPRVLEEIRARIGATA